MSPSELTKRKDSSGGAEAGGEYRIDPSKQNHVQQTKLRKDEKTSVKKSNNERAQKISMHYIKHLLELKDDFPNKQLSRLIK